MKAASCLASRCFSRRIRSIARLPAVGVSPPPGVGGNPGPGHFSSAATSASPAASSARSMSPNRRTREAIRRPYSSRKTRSTAAVPGCIGQSWCAGSGEAVERTDLDLATARLGPLRRKVERHVEVRSVDDPETADDLLGLEVGPVGHLRLLAPAVDDGRRRRGLQPTGEHPVAIGAKPVIERAGRGERLLHLLLGAVVAELVPLGGAVHAQQVVRHLSSPQFRAVPMTAFTLTTNGLAPI